MRATVKSLSPLMVRTRTSLTDVPARLPTDPALGLSVGATVLIQRSEGELIILARLS